jgi:hypothetical protein
MATAVSPPDHRSAPNRTAGRRHLLSLGNNAYDEGGDCREAHDRTLHARPRGKYAQYGKHDTYFQ